MLNHRPAAVTRGFGPAIACAFILVSAALIRAHEQPAIHSPEQFFGFPIGAERKLARWDRIVEYFHEVDRGSDRVVLQELGKTTMGLPYIVAVVSSPDTIANLSRYQAMQKAMADPRRTGTEEAARIAREGKAVLLIGANVHATEIGSSQMAITLLHQLATEQTPWVEHVLRNVIVLLIPSQNPDGQQMVVDWYNQNLGTEYEDAPLPELYHKYAGHDNNRDSYMLTQVETQYLTRLTYQDWFPEVYLDVHQMGSSRARIFVPPFKNPPNPNVDPLVWSEVNLLGQAMATRLHEAGKSGVIWGEQYSGFWQGANSTNPWWHNMVALLTETASSRLGTTVRQDLVPERQKPRSDPGHMMGGWSPRDPSVPLPPPTDTQYRMNYPQPWLGGSWGLADVVEYQLLSTLGLLESVANNREMLKRNFYLMNRRSIDLYAKGSPFAYVVPPEQRDAVAAARLLYLLQAEAAEVHRADAPFVADGRTFPAGSHVLLLAQPFGRWVKDMLEPQDYPDIRWPFSTAPIDRPYDVTAWTLGMLMGVETIRIDRPFDARLTLVTDTPEAPAGRLTGSGPIFVLPHEPNNSVIAVNRLLKAGARISWAAGTLQAGNRTHPPGAILVEHVSAETAAAAARDLKIDIGSLAEMPSDALEIRLPRIALYEPWGGNMDSGWTRWLLEQHEFSYVHARPADLRTPDLDKRFDTIVFPEMTVSAIMRGNQAHHVRPEHRGGIGDEGVRHLREFVERGGTVIALGNAAEFTIQQLDAPFENVVDGNSQDEFYCPGSLLRMAVDIRHPIAYGMPEQADAMFINNGGYRPLLKPSATSTTVIARYPAGPLLRSGWIIGEDRLRGSGAVLEAVMGRGRIILHTFRVQSRAQTWGTFKLLFNSLFYGPAVAGRPAYGTTEMAAAGR